MIRLLPLAVTLGLAAPCAAEPLLPVPFQMTETGQMRDPTGLWSPAEVAEGGSDVQPSVLFATFPVRGGTVTLAVLIDAWCGMTECPMRFRLVTDEGRELRNFAADEYGTVCQAPEAFFYDPEALVLHACDARLSLVPEFAAELTSTGDAPAFAPAPGVLPASALDFPSPGPAAAWNNLILGTTQTDGSIDIVIAERPDPVALGHLLDLLVLNTGFQVRVSVFPDVEARGEVLAQVYAFREATGVPLHVCRDWWSWPGSEDYAARLRERFGGSLVFIDNGETSDAYDNPNGDLVAAMRLDPLFAGATSDALRRVDDADDYFVALEVLWLQIADLDAWDVNRLLARGGWIDGCGGRR